ncbi:MAG: hypothetical protein DRN96_08445 [Thermoproteota archaeon]|nr:MAG: hypothetical protein DRN96_08445 [Candidatus Korarchaeota archaeon]
MVGCLKTIAVTQAVYRELSEAKRRMKARSFSEVILRLLEAERELRLMKVKSKIERKAVPEGEPEAIEEAARRLRLRAWWGERS